MKYGYVASHFQNNPLRQVLLYHAWGLLTYHKCILITCLSASVFPLDYKLSMAYHTACHIGVQLILILKITAIFMLFC